MSTPVIINGVQLPPIEHRGQRVVTLTQVDAVHKRATGTARRNFNTNRARLIPGEDFFEVTQADEIRSLGLHRQQGGTASKIVLLAEQGYLMLVKSLNDDLAWDVQRKLVKSYFRKEAAPPAIPYSVGPRDTLTEAQQEELRMMFRETAQRLPREAAGDFMIKGWSKLKAHFKVKTYRQIPSSEFVEAQSIAARHIAEYRDLLGVTAPAAPRVDQLQLALDSIATIASGFAQLVPNLMAIAKDGAGMHAITAPPARLMNTPAANSSSRAKKA